MSYETMEYDVIIVGAGPSGLAAGIQLKQLAQQNNHDINVCILEKGSTVGAHILSGAVLDPISLKKLLPDTWKNAPLDTPVHDDTFYYMTKQKSYRMPTPRQMKNENNYIISLVELCHFLAEHAEQLGCEIYPGFAASEILYNGQGEVIGVATGDMGIDKHGEKTPNYQPGMHLHAKQTIFAEGCRGQLSKNLMNRFNLREQSDPQTYAIGIKEVWSVLPENHKPGQVIHTIGWPLDHKTYGGSFIYHWSKNRVSIGFVVGLDYENPYLSPFDEMQRFKTHPYVSKLLQGGERIEYGARALSEGGWQSLPKLTFPGGVIVGDAAGFLNVPKIKGIHTAMESGMIAASACFEALSTKQEEPIELKNLHNKLKASWLSDELYQIRNIRPGFKYGLIPGLVNAAFETYITFGKSPWTLKNHADHKCIKTAKDAKKINYPKPDGKLTFDKLSSVFLTNTFHEENQPSHLILKDDKIAIDVNYKLYDSPETRYCPAAVYEIVHEGNKPKLQINAQNCIHCKTLSLIHI